MFRNLITESKRETNKKALEFFPLEPVWDKKKEWVLEIGPGKGEFLLWLAAEQPQKFFIVIEIKKGRFNKITKKIEARKLENIILVRGDARVCLPELFKEDALSEAFILFPDPWPKRRHHKHRLLQLDLVKQIHQFLKPGAMAWIATDHENYAQQIQSVFPEQDWQYQEGKSLYPTYFETKWKNLGREIFYFCFIKRPDTKYPAPPVHDRLRG